MDNIIEIIKKYIITLDEDESDLDIKLKELKNNNSED